jgi:uncharacterized protein
MGNSETVQKIIQSLSGFSLKKIYIFGSQVSGQTHPGSDFDICIILDRNIDKNKFIDDAYRKMWDLRIPVDLCVFYEDEFLSQIHSINTIPNEVASSGQIIYAA